MLLLLLGAGARAQEAAGPDPAAVKPADPWLARASALTDDLSKDAAALGEFERVMLWARLGGAWWKDDEERARGWLLRAVEAAESGPENEAEAARARRLDTARSLLPLVAPRDGKLGRRLVALLERSAEGAAGEGEGRNNARALADAARAALDSDPQLALALAADSLRAGTSFELVDLAFHMRARDPKLADALFAEGLARAHSDADAELLELLSGIGFPAQTYPDAFPADYPAPSDAARARLLALVSGRLLHPAATRQEEERNCAYAANTARLLGEFARLLPAQSGAAHTAVRRCLATYQSPAARQHLEDSINAQEMKGADNLLRAASEAKDERLRFSYRMKAAYQFYGEGKPERALEVLDSFTPREYEKEKELIDNWRWWFSSLAALKRLRENDLYGARKIIDSVPADLRGYTLVNFLQEASLAPRRPGKAVPEELRRTIIPEYITEARKLLARPGIPGTAYFTLVALAKLSGEYAPGDAPEILREAAAASNRDVMPTVGPLEKAVRSSEEDALMPQALPASLLETDETAASQALASIESPGRRARLRLGLLASALEERRRAPEKPRRAKDAAPQGQSAARP
ncbi:MAG: hypothetical protein LC800_01250 [Acidobacteria bacterium]|nr:hypothetical protein [Acidobacteriota bacterium]